MRVVLSFLLVLLWVCAGVRCEWVWPLGNSSSAIDWRQSSPFGPRLKASESYRYDYHRGIDIPCNIGDPLYAVAPAEVIIAGNHTAYSDPLVQLKHAGASQLYGNTDVYTNYLHVSGVNVTAGDFVSKGQQVAVCGKSASGFAHVHFEVRDGGRYQKNAVHPWHYLPYPTLGNISVSINGSWTSTSDQLAAFNILCPFKQMDVLSSTLLVRVEAKFNNDADFTNQTATSNITWHFDLANFVKTPVVSGSSNLTILDTARVRFQESTTDPWGSHVAYTVVTYPGKYNGLTAYPNATWTVVLKDIDYASLIDEDVARFLDDFDQDDGFVVYVALQVSTVQNVAAQSGWVQMHSEATTNAALGLFRNRQGWQILLGWASVFILTVVSWRPRLV